tara:strand:- start:978 stop:1145 length:168 start_codon:yes stop_codon:yes gene_type:complete
MRKESKNSPLQRKTTLKWRSDGELSEIDMARVLSNINNSSLTSCDLRTANEEMDE